MAESTIGVTVPTTADNAESVAAELATLTGFKFYIQEDGTLKTTATAESLAAIVEASPYKVYGDDGNVLSGDIDNDLPAVAGTVKVGVGDTLTTLPAGMRLVKVTDPSGSDASAIFHVVSTVFGVDVGFEVGDVDRLNELFGGVAAFDDVSRLTQAQYDSSDVLALGSVDEVAGSTQSLQAQYETDLRAAGLENPPAWMVADQRAMATMISATNEGWSAERTWGALAKLDSFQTRFPGFDAVQTQLGTTSIGDSIAEYTSREAQIRASLLRYRGPNAVTSPEYVSQLIGSGWQAYEVGELLELESEVKGNEAAFGNINEILAAQGIPALSGGDFVDLLSEERRSDQTDFIPSELFEAVNDALRQTALQGAGLNVGPDLAEKLGSGVSDSIMSLGDFRDNARYTAAVIAANDNELDLGKYGLNRDSVIEFLLGDGDDPDVQSKLDRLGRERGKAAQGFASSSSFIGGDGRLRVQGFSDV